VELLKVAADNGSPDAIYTLADMNFFGNYSHPRNFTEAFRRYSQLTSLNGNSSAQFMVGFFYSTGLGDVVKRDQAKELLYYAYAAEQGNERAQMAMGYIHTIGIGVPKSCLVAVSHYKSVADKAMHYIWSGPPGGHRLPKTTQRISDEQGGIYGEGASVSSAGQNARHGPANSDEHASPDDILEYLDLMSRKGDPKATLTYGKMCYDGQKGLKPDYQEAKQRFLEVARLYWSKGGKVNTDVSRTVESLASRAAGYLGRMFLRGEGMEPSVEIARTWLKRGVSNGDPLSQYYLGLMHLEGLGVPKDAKRAADLFTVAADQGYPPAQVKMGGLFLDQGDWQTAAKYFDLAARLGNVEALYYLAELTLSGLLGDASCDMANHYYKSVAEKAEGVVSSFEEANSANESGDIDLALLDYMLAADQGFEVAQTNVAFLLDKQSRTSISARLSSKISTILSWIPQRITLPITMDLAFLYWARSARQFNVDALIKMGDYWLLGVGVDQDQTKAAACYQTAAETLSSAQALWNIGWMHENGVGGMEQDFHLAKRYYDQALEINKEAYLAVKLSLLKLRLRSRWNEWTHGGIKSIQDERSKFSTVSFMNQLRTILTRHSSPPPILFPGMACYLPRGRRGSSCRSRSTKRRPRCRWVSGRLGPCSSTGRLNRRRAMGRSDFWIHRERSYYWSSCCTSNSCAVSKAKRRAAQISGRARTGCCC
jgi:SEL1 protein